VPINCGTPSPIPVAALDVDEVVAVRVVLDEKEAVVVEAVLDTDVFVAARVVLSR
jgi:hypothetical protein